MGSSRPRSNTEDKRDYKRIGDSKLQIALDFSTKLFEIFKIASQVRDFLDNNDVPKTHKDTVIVSITEYLKTNDQNHLKVALNTFNKICVKNPAIDKNKFRQIFGLSPDPDLAHPKTSAARKKSSISQEFSLGDDGPKNENTNPNMNDKPVFSQNDFLHVHEQIQEKKQTSIQNFKNAYDNGDLNDFIKSGSAALEKLSTGLSSLLPEKADEVEMAVSVVKDTINNFLPGTFPDPKGPTTRRNTY